MISLLVIRRWRIQRFLPLFLFGDLPGLQVSVVQLWELSRVIMLRSREVVLGVSGSICSCVVLSVGLRSGCVPFISDCTLRSRVAGRYLVYIDSCWCCRGFVIELGGYML